MKAGQSEHHENIAHFLFDHPLHAYQPRHEDRGGRERITRRKLGTRHTHHERQQYHDSA